MSIGICHASDWFKYYCNGHADIIKGLHQVGGWMDIPIEFYYGNDWFGFYCNCTYNPIDMPINPPNAAILL